MSKPRLAMSLWQENKADYGPMMLSLYVTLGIFLLIAARSKSQPDRLRK
jgi:hypothetical protein